MSSQSFHAQLSDMPLHSATSAQINLRASDRGFYARNSAPFRRTIRPDKSICAGENLFRLGFGSAPAISDSLRSPG
jgi:hypothetical protein